MAIRAVNSRREKINDAAIKKGTFPIQMCDLVIILDYGQIKIIALDGQEGKSDLSLQN